MNVVIASPLFKRNIRNDPFYKAPSGFKKAKEGTVFRIRKAPNPIAFLSAFPQNIKDVYQILYRTTDGLGQPTVTVTTLMVPYNADTSKLVSYQVMQDSSSPECGPSQALQQGDGLRGIVTQAELLYMDTLLGRGWYVNVPDYESFGGYFGVGAMAGHAVLDSVRAVLASSKTTKIKKNADIQLWGYSGGAIASGWASQLKESYAPELNIIGAVIGGTPANLNSTLSKLDGGPYSGFALAGINGLANQYKDASKYLDSILKPNKKNEFYKANDLCLAQLLPQYPFKDMSSYFTRADYLNDPIADKVLNQNIMGKLKPPKFPLFMYHAEKDQVVPYAPASTLYQKWCKDGGNIHFVKDKLSEHIILFVTGAANAINFLTDRFDNKTFAPGCSSRTTATSILDPGAIATFGEVIFELLGALLRLPIGPNNL
ncbi:putative secretory lipase [Cunninghamella echinulata]|nr:putative secretory lipase [Cunninghamella echinulata]